MGNTPSPTPPRVGGALDSVNDTFHREYDEARGKAELDAPVIVMVADTLVVVHRGERRELPITLRFSHVIKSAAHAPVALFAALHRLEGRALDPSTRTRIEALRDDVVASLSSLGGQATADEQQTILDLRAVLSSTHAYMELVLDTREKTVEVQPLATFARDTGPLLLQLTAHATRVQLDALDACVGDALAAIDPAERRALQVVVTGDHQARVRSLGMQYFRKRLREPEGTEDRVTYAAGVTDVDEALALVGRRRLDAAIAAAFFGDEKRLQRDVLGDAVHALLRDRDLAPIT